MTRVLALDCEMVGVGFGGKRNALARVSLVCDIIRIPYCAVITACSTSLSDSYIPCLCCSCGIHEFRFKDSDIVLEG